MEDLKQQYLDELKRLSNLEYRDEEPDKYQIMRDEHLDTIPATESDEFIKSSVENLILIPSEPEGIPDHSSEVMEIVTPKVGGIEASNDNPIPFYDPIISGTPPNLTPSGESDFFLEVDAFLAVEDEPTLSQIPKSYLNPDGDMLLLEAFINDDHSFDFKTKNNTLSFAEKESFHFDIPPFSRPPAKSPDCDT
nr:hypothetical protein [Tanacetum cinerariifolium]